MQWNPVLSGINKTYHPHNDDKIEPQGLDIALVRSFRGHAPIKRLARTGARGELIATPSIWS